MDLKKVLFVGGDPQKLASVQIRCVDIAYRLKCDCLLNARSVDEIPSGYSVYVCVKPSSGQSSLSKLAKKGLVVWDIIDALPPKDNVGLYLASTKVVQQNFSDYGRVEWIPHHHCNTSARFNSKENRRPGWIGSKEWIPQIKGLRFDKYPVQGMTQEDVVRTMRKIGIGLNFRGGGPWASPGHPAKLNYDFHLALNSGIKLINCIGFGIPSISADEPAYYEIGKECTIFSTTGDCAKWVRELKNDLHLYSRLRNSCIRRAKEYHLDTITQRYKMLLQSL